MTSVERPRVGFIGLGIMGGPMAGHILRAGYPLAVWNRTAAKTESLTALGAQRAASPATLADGCDVIITMVNDGPDVEEVLFGDNGPFNSGRVPTARTVIDMTTISPSAARDIGARLADRGVDFLDAPVTGGDTGAINATLTIMVGGEESAFERAKPLLQVMGRRVIHVGPGGNGQMVKACNQILCAVNLIGVCEALSLAAKSGIAPATMLEVVTSGAGGSWSLENLGRKIVNGDLAPAFMTRLLQKDLRAVMQAAQDVQLPLPGAALAQQLFRIVEAEGASDLGTQALILAYQRMGQFSVVQPSR